MLWICLWKDFLHKIFMLEQIIKGETIAKMKKNTVLKWDLMRILEKFFRVGSAKLSDVADNCFLFYF